MPGLLTALQASLSQCQRWWCAVRSVQLIAKSGGRTGGGFSLVQWRIKSDNRRVTLKTCTVSCEDAEGHQHAVEVTAESLYEAVAQALVTFRGDEWMADIGKGHTVTVRVQQPAIEHRVRVAEFERWLAQNGKSPSEMTLKVRLRLILTTKD